MFSSAVLSVNVSSSSSSSDDDDDGNNNNDKRTATLHDLPLLSCENPNVSCCTAGTWAGTWAWACAWDVLVLIAFATTFAFYGVQAAQVTLNATVKTPVDPRLACATLCATSLALALGASQLVSRRIRRVFAIALAALTLAKVVLVLIVLVALCAIVFNSQPLVCTRTASCAQTDWADASAVLAPALPVAYFLGGAVACAPPLFAVPLFMSPSSPLRSLPIAITRRIARPVAHALAGIASAILFMSLLASVWSGAVFALVPQTEAAALQRHWPPDTSLEWAASHGERVFEPLERTLRQVAPSSAPWITTLFVILQLSMWLCVAFTATCAVHAILGVANSYCAGADVNANVNANANANAKKTCGKPQTWLALFLLALIVIAPLSASLALVLVNLDAANSNAALSSYFDFSASAATLTSNALGLVPAALVTFALSKGGLALRALCGVGACMFVLAFALQASRLPSRLPLPG